MFCGRVLVHVLIPSLKAERVSSECVGAVILSPEVARAPLARVGTIIPSPKAERASSIDNCRHHFP